MSGSRRIVKIEENVYKESASVIKLKEKVLQMQAKLLSEICVPAAKPTRRRSLAETIDTWITKKILNESETTFKSVASVNYVFEDLLSNLNQECEKLGIATTHGSLCEGMRLLLRWYHLLALDAVIQAPLAVELANQEREVLNKPEENAKKRNLLIKQIQHFNFKISDLEERYSRNKVLALDYKEEDPGNLYYPLLKEEKALSLSTFAGLDHLLKERQALEKDVAKLEQEADEAVADYKRTSIAAKEKRCKLSSKLNDIDVYYVKEFKENEKNYIPIYNYKKTFDPATLARADKILAIESLITSVTAPLNEFNADIAKYYYLTYTYPVGLYQTAVNGINALLNKELNEFRSKSKILVLDREYDSEYKYISETLPVIRQEVEKDYAKAVNDYLRIVVSRSWNQVMAIRDEAKKNLDTEMNEYIKTVLLSSEGLEIKPIRLQEMFKNYLNQSWTDSFDKFFNKELAGIKAEFERLQADKSNQALEQLKHLKNNLPEAKAILFEKVVTAKNLPNRFSTVSALLVDVYNRVERDPVFQTIERYISQRTREIEQEQQRQLELKKSTDRQREAEALAERQRRQQELERVKQQQELERVKQQKELERNDSNKNGQDTEAKRAPNPDSEHPREHLPPDIAESQPFPWKRVIFWGLVTLALAAAALTLVGFLAEITVLLALSIIGGSLLIGGGGYGFTSCYSRNDAAENSVGSLSVNNSSPPLDVSTKRHPSVIYKGEPSTKTPNPAGFSSYKQGSPSASFFSHRPQYEIPANNITSRTLKP